MTVKELIEALGTMDEDAEVYFSHPSHDHWRTELASPVRDLSEAQLVWSDYHDEFEVNDNESDLSKLAHRAHRRVVLLTRRR